MEIEFKRDTAFRKQFFTPESFAHPAKMDAHLLLWIVEKYSQPGETILDPMAGMGTTMLACTLGRNVVLVELEEKFYKMMAGYDCDGKVYSYEDIQLEKEIKKGWHLILESGWASWDDDEVFTSKEEALQYGRENYSDYQETDKNPINDGGSYFSTEYRQYQPAKYARQPKPSTCGKRGKHKPHHIAGNWEIVRTKPQLGFQMGNCQIIQGDSRQLEGLLVDKCVFSPPHGNRLSDAEVKDGDPQRMSYRQALGKVEKIITSPPYAEAHDTKNLGVGDGDRADLRAYSWLKDDNPDNISNLPYGQIEKIITNPPYEGSLGRDRSKEDWWDEERENRLSGGSAKIAKGYQADRIITSPPYEGSFTHSEQDPEKRLQRLREVDEEGVKKGAKWATTSDEALRRRLAQQDGGYGSREENIGNLKSQSYLEAMLQVYQQCHKVLKPQGLMILVVKNFIRNKQVVRLDKDTIKLCEQAGFSFVERHYRKLTFMSFWRKIYHQKFPGVEKIEHEDVLVFQRFEGEQ